MYYFMYSTFIIKFYLYYFICIEINTKRYVKTFFLYEKILSINPTLKKWDDDYRKAKLQITFSKFGQNSIQSSKF